MNGMDGINTMPATVREVQPYGVRSGEPAYPRGKARRGGTAHGTYSDEAGEEASDEETANTANVLSGAFAKAQAGSRNEASERASAGAQRRNTDAAKIIGNPGNTNKKGKRKKGSRGLCFFLSLFLIFANVFTPLGGLAMEPVAGAIADMVTGAAGDAVDNNGTASGAEEGAGGAGNAAGGPVAALARVFAGPEEAEAATTYPLEVVSTLVANTPAGGYTDVAIKIKNTSDKKVTGISLIEYPILGPKDDQWTPYVFQYSNSSGSDKCKDPVNATKDDDGYTIKAGQTATFYVRVFNDGVNKGRGIGTFTDTIQFGKHHREYYSELDPEDGGYWISRRWVIDARYTAKVKIKNVVYNPNNAVLTLGTSSNNGVTIKEFKTIDFGSVDLSKTSSASLKQSKTFYVKNISASDKDQKGNPNNISVSMDVESPYSYYTDGYTGRYIFDFDDHLTNGMSWAPLAPAKANSFSAASGTVSLDATKYIAGTYTGKLVVNTVPYGAKVNGLAGDNEGYRTISIKVKLTGTNPRLPGKPTSFKVTPGNNQAELTWKAPKGYDKEGLAYTVYRRDGEETKTNPNTWTVSDWKRYERISGAQVYAKEDGTFLYVDGTVKNGKTYTYVVIAGMPFQGYASTPVTVKPLSKYTSKIQAPERVFPNDRPGGVLLEWQMNENYGGARFSGESLVDHFNIYRDGVLVAQVMQNAVIDEGYYGYVDDGAGGYVYGITSHEYSWEYFVETPATAQNYVFNVAAVSKAGVEGYWSEDISGNGDCQTIEIVGHSALYKTYYDEKKDKDIPYITVSAELNSWGDNYESISVWRSEGTTAPKTTGKPLMKVEGKGFDDYSVSKGKTYTYTIQVTDYNNDKSNLYTFTMKAANDSGGSGTGDYSSARVQFHVLSGKKVQMTWNADTDSFRNPYGTYKVYRNGSLQKTYTMKNGMDSYIDFTQDPGKDGTYVYRVDKIVNGITIKGKEYTFVRNTKKVDESKFLKAPGAPTLDVRISNGTPVLTWTPSTKGGAPEGYHIYRRDNGELVQSGRDVQLAAWYPVNFITWGNGRYLTIQDPKVTTFVDSMQPASTDGKYGYYLGDTFKGELLDVRWYEDACPHEYYITAYNSAGESAPSKVFTFEYMGEDEEGYPKAPENDDEDPPGQPKITKVWVDWEDESQTMYDGSWDTGIGGYIRVAWKDTELGGGIDSWDISVSGLRYEKDPITIYYSDVMKDLEIRNGNDHKYSYHSVQAGTGDEGDVGRTASLVVKAVNSAGATKSAAAKIKIRSFPRIRTFGENNSVKIEWTDLYNDTKTKVTSWEIWRKGEYGGWSKIKTISAGSISYEKLANGKAKTDKNGVKNYYWRDTTAKNGWEYEYKVVAKCNDNVDRPSAVRSSKPATNAASEAPGKPTNLTAQIINGEIQLNWKAPTTGGNPGYFVIEWYVSTPYESYWSNLDHVAAPSLNYVWYGTPEEPGTYKFRIYAYNEINGRIVPEEEDRQYSNTAAVTLTKSDIKKRATKNPGEFTLTATPGDNQITLNWTGSKDATYYEIYRDPGWEDVSGTIVVSSTTRKYVDKTADPGTRYRYSVVARNSYGSHTEDVGARSEGKSHQDIIDEYVYKEAIKPVQQKIDALPKSGNITASNLDDVAKKAAAARKAYNQLTPDSAKKLVDISKLEEAERKIASLKQAAADKKEADKVSDLISKLPATVTTKSEADIKAAREAYEKLTDEQKALVPEKAKKTLEEKEAKLADLKGTNIKSAKVTGITSKTYTGKAVTQNITVKIGTTTLKQGTDYKVEYKNNVKVGTATMTITGIGKYGGTLTKTFKITECTHKWDEGKVTKEATTTAEGVMTYTCTICKATKTEKIPKIIPASSKTLRRAYGDTRYDTALAIADAYIVDSDKVKSYTNLMGVRTPSLDAIIVACGSNFPDALAASYLAKVKKAPVIVWRERENAKIQKYIRENLKPGKTVYIMGGTGAVSSSIGKGLTGYKFVRLGDENRYGTNVKILNAAKVTGGEILVCAGTSFEDALIASATGKPILLVKPTGVTREGLNFIAGLKDPKFTIIGNTKNVSGVVDGQLAAYGTVTRVTGSTPDQLSVNVAKKYFVNPKEVVIATSNDYPDGLCGGILAIQNKAPLMLVTDGQNANSAAYCSKLPGLERVTALGGEGVVSEIMAKKLLNIGKAKLTLQTIYWASNGNFSVRTRQM